MNSVCESKPGGLSNGLSAAVPFGINVQTLIRLALEEDVGPGDITTQALVPDQQKAEAIIVAKEPMVVAGLVIAEEVFLTLDTCATFARDVEDGDRVDAGQEILRAKGKLSALLVAERTALNFLQRLSGIATLTNQFVTKLRGYDVRITDTRKTTPGWRALEKYAVRVGGGHNHRFGLYDGILIKDNHLRAVAGQMAQAVKRAREYATHLMRVEVEVTTLEEVREALACGVDIIMLDNMDLETISMAVSMIGGRAIVEVSGGVNLSTVADLAATGVNIISAGALTHSARAVDISMGIRMLG